MAYAQLVIGPTGSGKSTYCSSLYQHCETLGRSIHIVNLNPAAENFDYPVAMDIRELISLDDVMEELGLGPNGGLIYCMEYRNHTFAFVQFEKEEGLKKAIEKVNNVWIDGKRVYVGVAKYKRKKDMLVYGILPQRDNEKSNMGIVKPLFHLGLVQKGLESDGIKVKVVRWGYAWKSCIVTFGSTKELEETWAKKKEDCTSNMMDLSVARVLLRVESPFDVPDWVIIGAYGRSYRVTIKRGLSFKHLDVESELSSEAGSEYKSGDVAAMEEEEKGKVGLVEGGDMSDKDKHLYIDMWLVTRIIPPGSAVNFKWNEQPNQNKLRLCSESNEDKRCNKIEEKNKGDHEPEIEVLDKDLEIKWQQEENTEVKVKSPKRWKMVYHVSTSLSIRSAPDGRREDGRYSRVYRRSRERRICKNIVSEVADSYTASGTGKDNRMKRRCLITKSLDLEDRGNLLKGVLISLAQRSAGGLICMWNENVFQVKGQHVHSRFLVLVGNFMDDQKEYVFINVYGPSSESEKGRVLWGAVELWEVVSDPEKIKPNVFNFFKTAYNSNSTLTVEGFNFDFKKLTQSQSAFLEEEFSEQEVWQVISSLENAKSPGPDGFTMANEGIDSWREQGLQQVVFKVDLVELMILWNILVNGSPTEEFSIAKGLRQGCSLSPLLSNMVGELLHMMLDKAVELGAVFWSIWKMRNGIVFEKGKLDIFSLFSSSDSDNISAFKELNRPILCWSPPPVDFFKMNVDEAVSSVGMIGGIGGILRDWNRTILISFSKNVGPTPPPIAELKAIKKGIDIFISSEWVLKGRLIIESYCKLAVD
ncbi:hypothetical protein F3Y22_tig00112989pilonHSYRG00048 [Hibiscus syriacus]|uniref:RRM domain-containing protein n=1 Tax=Hibiscus syriacus TaxID=106335 RepID=A0A6A2Y458_HIBSY|nr:hypothetical protein F3Y22_tig00112989pilonHSYRG00048 [Hibiscus syriacus]